MRAVGTILALDLATVLGWAVAVPGEEPVYGSMRLPHDRGDGAFFHAYRRWLLDHITVHAPRLIVYEAPIITGSKTSLQTAMRLMGLVAHTTEIACVREVRCEPANNQTVKKHATGDGRADKRLVIDAMRRLGWQPDNDNAADALAILLWAEAKWAPAITRASGPLFGRAIA